MADYTNYHVRLFVDGQVIEAEQEDRYDVDAIALVMIKNGICFCERAETDTYVLENVWIDDEVFTWEREYDKN